MRYERIHFIRRSLLWFARHRPLVGGRWASWYWQHYSKKNAPRVGVGVFQPKPSQQQSPWFCALCRRDDLDSYEALEEHMAQAHPTRYFQ